MKHDRSFRLLVGLLITAAFSLSPAARGQDSAAPVFRAPADPPGAAYIIEASIAAAGGTVAIKGKETITFVNSSPLSLSVLAFEWNMAPSRALEMSVDGRPLRRLNESKGMPLGTPLLYELPSPLAPGREIRLESAFTYQVPAAGPLSLPAWYPRLWWEGIPVRDSYRVRLDVPPGYTLAASGRLDRKTGFYENDCVTTRFGIFLSNALLSEERESAGVLIKALFTEKGAACARFCLEAAADIIPFYKKWLGAYPHKSLCIIPGGPQPWGGYPFASGVVVIHGQETFDPAKGEKELRWWKWITAHEIGHQYWGEFIMSDDSRTHYTDSWLMIGMGINADKEYLLARNMGWTRYRGFIDGYLQGVKAKFDTTIDAPPSLARTQKFDTNNVVIHGKGFAVVSALETLLGHELFDAIYRKTLATFGGKRLGWRDFRRLCEAESGQDLGWFFEDWVRTNKVLECRVASRTSTPAAAGFVSEVRVEYGMDSIRMPVPVRAFFEDGTSQDRRTDRFARTEVLRFESRARLKDVRLDPDGRLALVTEPIPRTAADLADAVENLDWTGTGDAALSIVRRPEAAGIKDAHVWFKLGLLLFDGGHYPESFEAFKRCGELDRTKNNLFGALVWMGITKDLLGDRQAAVGYYNEALKNDAGSTLQHDQYGLRINKAWVEERLKTPFKRTP